MKEKREGKKNMNTNTPANGVKSCHSIKSVGNGIVLGREQSFQTQRLSHVEQAPKLFKCVHDQLMCINFVVLLLSIGVGLWWLRVS